MPAGDAEIVITMLPAGQQVREVYLGTDGILAAAQAGTLLIDCSTIDVDDRARRSRRPRKAGACRCSTRRCRAASAARRPARSPSWSAAATQAFERARPMLEADGQDDRACGRSGQRPGGEDLQQHDPRHLDDRGVGSLSAGREARPRRAEAVRHFLEVVGPVLVDDELLPGAGTGADFARQPRLSRPASPPR